MNLNLKKLLYISVVSLNISTAIFAQRVSGGGTGVEELEKASAAEVKRIALNLLELTSNIQELVSLQAVDPQFGEIDLLDGIAPDTLKESLLRTKVKFLFPKSSNQTWEYSRFTWENGQLRDLESKETSKDAIYIASLNTIYVSYEAWSFLSEIQKKLLVRKEYWRSFGKGNAENMRNFLVHLNQKKIERNMKNQPNQGVSIPTATAHLTPNKAFIDLACKPVSDKYPGYVYIDGTNYQNLRVYYNGIAVSAQQTQIQGRVVTYKLRSNSGKELGATMDIAYKASFPMLASMVLKRGSGSQVYTCNTITPAPVPTLPKNIDVNQKPARRKLINLACMSTDGDNRALYLSGTHGETLIAVFEGKGLRALPNGTSGRFIHYQLLNDQNEIRAIMDVSFNADYPQTASMDLRSADGKRSIPHNCYTI